MIRKNGLEAFYVLGLFGVLESGFLWLVDDDNEIFPRGDQSAAKRASSAARVPPSFHLGDLRTIIRVTSNEGQIRAVRTFKDG